MLVLGLLVTSLFIASSLFRASMLFEQPLTATFEHSHLCSLIAQLVSLDSSTPHLTHTGRHTSPTCPHHPCHVLHSLSLFFFSFSFSLSLLPSMLASDTTQCMVVDVVGVGVVV